MELKALYKMEIVALQRHNETETTYPHIDELVELFQKLRQWKNQEQLRPEADTIELNISCDRKTDLIEKS